MDDLPDAPRLMALLRANAALDAILMPDWELRYFSFNSRWDDAEDLGSLRNGQGTEIFCLFSSEVSFLKGFEPDYPDNGGGLTPSEQALLPRALLPAVNESAFDMSNVSYVAFWSAAALTWTPVRPSREGWSTAVSGGLSLMMDDPKVYTEWANEYYETEVDIDIVTRVQSGEPLSEDVIAKLNPYRDIAELVEEMREIGFPVSINGGDRKR